MSVVELDGGVKITTAKEFKVTILEYLHLIVSGVVIEIIIQRIKGRVKEVDGNDWFMD